MKVVREIKRINDLPEYDFDHPTLRRDMQVDTVVQALEGCAPDLLEQVAALTKENEALRIAAHFISDDDAEANLRNEVYRQQLENNALTEQVEKLKKGASDKALELLEDLYSENVRENKHLKIELSRLREACKQLIECNHQEHFATRLNNEEMKGIDMIKSALRP